MKVAILISGQPRNFEKGFWELHDKYLSRYDCDVFFHTWNGDKFVASQFFSAPPNEYSMDSEWKLKLIDLYKPKKFLFEDQTTFDPSGYKDPVWRQSLNNTMSMFYSLHKAFSLVDNSYDMYIRTRFDLRYEEATAKLESLTPNYLHLWDWKTDHRVKHHGLYDVFAAGTYDQIGIYSQVFPKLNFYLNYDDDYSKFLQGDSKLRNEYLLKWHLIKSGVLWKEHETKVTTADGQIIR